MSQPPLQSIWDTYTASWKTDSAADRTALFTQSLDPACTYNDPLATAQGWDQLTAYMDNFRSQVPGGHFVTHYFCLLYTSPSPRDQRGSRMPSSA